MANSRVAFANSSILGDKDPYLGTKDRRAPPESFDDGNVGTTFSRRATKILKQIRKTIDPRDRSRRYAFHERGQCRRQDVDNIDGRD